MNLKTFVNTLRQHPDFAVVFAFDDDEVIPAHYHVTEVGQVEKNFIDCGGTVRREATVQLQIWLGGDEDHRLTAGKLARIFDSAGSVVPNDGLEVEVEYEACVVSQYRVAAMSAADGKLVARLEDKHTDCLAKEACGAASETAAAGCCGPGGCN